MQKQKQKNELVFKLLQSMNPFFTEQAHRDQIRNHINSVINQQDSPEQQSNLCTITQQDIICQIYKVFDIQVKNGVFYDIVKKVTFSQNQSQQKQRQIKRFAKEIKDSIVATQSDIFKKFKIPVQVQHYSSTPSLLHHNRTLDKRSNPNIFSSSSLSNYSSSYTPSISKYRHETDKKRNTSIFAATGRQKQNAILRISSNINKNSSNKNNQINNMQTPIKKNFVKRQLFPQKTTASQFFSSATQFLPIQSKLSQNQTSGFHSTRTTFNNNNSSRTSSSQKVIKQSHKLNMQIFQSHLHRKMSQYNSHIYNN